MERVPVSGSSLLRGEKQGFRNTRETKLEFSGLKTEVTTMQLIQIRPETCERDNMSTRISLPGGTELQEVARNSKALQAIQK